MADLTELSQKMIERAFQAKTAQEAVQILRECQDFRTFREIMLAADPLHRKEAELRTCLVDGLAAMHPEKQRDSYRRKVSNWFAGAERPQDKGVVFELCMILKLSVTQANALMMRITEEAIHWRDPRDIIWAYALTNSFTYQETQALLADAQKMLDEPENQREPSPVLTSAVKQDVLDNFHAKPAELVTYLRENMQLWGAFHNRAYAYYRTCMSLLSTGASEKNPLEKKEKGARRGRHASLAPMAAPEDRFTAQEILETFFFRSLVDRTAEVSQVQNCVRRFWPDKTKISEMNNRKADVSRKTLILLHLATCAQTQEETRAQTFRLMLRKLNLMLHQCGFQPLDPRNPFDWMIIFCLCVHDPASSDERIQAVLQGLFPPPESGREK